jgi:hypothetical protein
MFVFIAIAVIISVYKALGLFRFHGLKLSLITFLMAAFCTVFMVYFTAVFLPTFDPNM